MGGLGSGRRYRLGTKMTAERCSVLDVLALYRAGDLAPGGACDKLDGVPQRDTQVTSATGLQGAYLIPVEWTPCPYGGRRPWFHCPAVGCDRRVRKLFRPPRARYYACRQCYGLAYESQRADAFTQARAPNLRIRQRLGGSSHPLDPFPEKPKGMRWATYDRLFAEAHAAELAALGIMSQWTEALLRDLERHRQ